MPRMGDNAPIGNTCPLIDDIISQVDNWYNVGEPISRNDVLTFNRDMEQLRKANSTLRDWGNDEYNEHWEVEKDLEAAKDEISDLKSEIESLKEEIKSLEKELSL